MKTIDMLKAALIEITDRSIAEGKGDELCSSKFFDDVHNAINELETILVDEDDVDEFITFSGLVELHIGNDTALQLNQFLKEYRFWGGNSHLGDEFLEWFEAKKNLKKARKGL